MNDVMNDLIDIYLEKKQLGDNDVEKVKREIASLEQEVQSKEQEVLGKKLLLKRLEDETKAKKEQDVAKAQEQNKLANTCLACNKVITGAKQPVLFGPYAGRSLCGSSPSSACYQEIAKDNVAWLIPKRPDPRGAK